MQTIQTISNHPMQKASAQPATAPGAPGIDPRWSRSAKEGVGTAYHTSCRVWFTLSGGIVSEIYFPTVDTPSTRDLQFLITDGQTFCHEEKRDLQHDMVMPQRDALFYQLTSGERNGRYRLIKHVLTDPHASVLLIHTRLEISDPSLRGKLRLYAFLAPHVAGRSADNMATVFDLGDRTLLSAERAGLHLVFGCDRGFSRRSVGYVGASDGRTQLNKGNFRLDCEYQEAGPGNIALTGEVNLSRTGDRNILWPSPTDGGDAAEFMLGVAFGDSRVSAAAKLLQAFAIPFECHRDAYAALWQRAAADPEEAKAIAEHTGDNGRLWRLSRNVLLAHEDKEFQGAIIASLSTPWGETKSAVELGGYHLVWTRDLIQSASALLATGQIATPWRALLWLTCIQKPDGSFPQNSWIDGTPYGPSIQLDEVAAPLLLGWRIWRVAPKDFDLAVFRPVLARATAYLIASGPVTAQDRWEENAGYSPFTLATIIAALCAAAELGRAHGLAAADFVLAYADWLNSHIEDWCVTNRGDLLADKPRHYTRITPADPLALDPHPDPDALMVTLANGGGSHPARRIVGSDFLQLVRLGIRPADDPLIHDSVAVLDAVLKRDLPGGSSWRRYPFDGYGEKADGSPFDGTGEGRCWPILTGERGHYELAAGRDPMPFILAMERFANSGGMMPEQVWDAGDLPDRELVRGGPTGSATPLCWTHAEYLTLVCSARAGRVVDRIEPAFRRYAAGGKRDSNYEMWTFRHRTRRLPAGRTLRLIVPTPAIVRWTADGWTNSGEVATTALSFGGLHYLDLDTAGLAIGAQVEWRFFWPEGNRLESGEKFRVEVV